MAKKKITQLDLFSGIGGFHLGFERAGYKVKSYFSEIDKHAIAVYKHQFKDAKYVGSVIDIDGNKLPRIDLITFGSPCQDFSLAGKRKGMGGERSSLVLEAIRLIDECRPSVFIWENVKGTFSSNNGADFAAILQAFANIGGYRLEWQLLNTSWVLPQNRERVYLVGYSTKPGRNWRGVFPIGGSGQQNSQLRTEACEVGDYRSDEGWRPRKDNNCPTLAARAREDGSGQPLLKIKSATKQGYEVAEEGDSINFSNPDSKTRRGRVGKGKAQTLDTGANQAVVQVGRIVGRNPENPKSRKAGLPTEQMLELNENTQKTNTLTSVQKDNVVVQPVAMKWERTEEGKRKRKENRDKEGKDYTSFKDRKLTPSDKPISNTITSFVEKDAMIHDTYRIRRLTPIECERLQGFPDNHTEYGIYDGEVKKMSNTQRYKQCGNAVTVDIVALVAEAVKPLFK
jgi:DNA (cytosine-5)-methyltransferase 1